jgi:glycosyltransferase involved in cell wall biosynthesis
MRPGDKQDAPFFTIAIPTRNRSRFARASAPRILAQDFVDFELIILDNSDAQELTTDEFRDARCTVIPATTVLSMRENWERTLDVARGTFVVLLSDKDMLLPGSLTRLAAAIREVDADIVNYRKAGFALKGPYQTFIQRCSGRLVEGDGDVVLRAWFNDVAHFHDAPMMYNSAVRREVLMELRGTGGRFFTGTSPDVGSGAVLMARLKKYHVLDRPLVVSWYGDWSIGMSSSLGAQGAAAAFFAEYRNDPIRAAGLVPGIPGSVAETLLDSKSRFPTLFNAYRPNWVSYVRNVLEELKSRDLAGIDTGAEREYLLNARGKKYSRLAVRLGTLRFELKSGRLISRVRARLERARQLRERSRTSHHDRATSSGESTPRPLQAYFERIPQAAATFRDVPYFSLPWANTVEEVERFATEVNSSLDATLPARERRNDAA